MPREKKDFGAERQISSSLASVPNLKERKSDAVAAEPGPSIERAEEPSKLESDTGKKLSQSKTSHQSVRVSLKVSNELMDALKDSSKELSKKFGISLNETTLLAEVLNNNQAELISLVKSK